MSKLTFWSIPAAVVATYWLVLIQCLTWPQPWPWVKHAVGEVFYFLGGC